MDEVNGAPDFTIFKGSAWQFTVEPRSIPLVDVTASASSTFGLSGPENMINGSGLVGDLHGTAADSMWISGAIPAAIEFTFDKPYKLDQLRVWNSNQLIESFLGFGAKDIAIETSADGASWTAIDGVGPLAQAPGAEGYAANNHIDLGGVTASHVRLTINSVYGFAPQASLSEVRFFVIPTFATRPNPENGATGVAPETLLAWGRNGREATSHDVYVGTSPDALTLAGSVSETSLDTSALDLQLGKTYHWRVDEVNEAETPSVWSGSVWDFTVVDAVVVDDMESYADKEFFEIWATWIDGFEDPSQNGSVVGANPAQADFSPETGIVNGGRQSLPIWFDNTGAPISEATRTFDQTRDWTRSGIQNLVLDFAAGLDNSGGQIYVKINDTKVVYPDVPVSDPAGGVTWTQWVIDLAGLGIDLSRVSSLTIGIEGPGASGVLYVDDITLR